MPIRFRCTFCNQLMGIAKRKAGAVVRCPACASQVTVPAPPSEQRAAPAPREPARRVPSPPIFERSDFGELFERPARAQAPGGSPGRLAPAVELPALPPAPAAKDDRPDPAPWATPERPPPGIWLTSGHATLLGIAAAVALALAFAAGLWLGMTLQARAQADPVGRAVPARAPGALVSGGWVGVQGGVFSCRP
jgi:hypothetical protein